MIFNLHIKSQLQPEALHALLVQSELTPRPGELRQLQQRVQAVGAGGAGEPERVGSSPAPFAGAGPLASPSSEQGAPLQTERSCAPLRLILEQKQTITPLTRRPRNAKYAVILS